MFWTIFAGIVFVLIGVFLILKTKLFWELTEKWKSYSSDEPSDFYIKSAKLGGILFIVIGIAIAVLPFIRNTD